MTFPIGPAAAVDPDLVPRVLEVSPRPGVEFLDLDNAVTFRFNTPIDPLTLLPLLLERTPTGEMRQGRRSAS